MSPFASYFHHLRVSYGYKQTKLSILMGYEQTYISAIEKDRKGPPNGEFIQRFIDVLQLSEKESENLFHYAKASNRKLLLDSSSSIETYWLIDELRNRLTTLSSAQISAIRSIIAIQDAKLNHSHLSTKLTYGDVSQEATM